ncbi:MAG TPA: hypothetical protein VJ974_00615 [Geopsychrobacteraceae bacterium]|nr:hypothetical protein [Geopsychrobacteraceae bacterium]
MMIQNVKKKFLFTLIAVFSIFSLFACGDGGVSQATGSHLQPATVTGTLATRTSVTLMLLNAITPVAAVADIPAALYLDDSTVPVYPDAQDHFVIKNIPDGDHSLFIRLEGGTEMEFPFRMADGRGLDFGLMTLANGQVHDFTGFNGYHFGWIDEDSDGINDNFTDIDGDGICDNNVRFAGYSYHMDQGFLDTNHDGFNDHFADADGDGINDLSGHRYGFGFGFTDADDDGANDRFVDADGDGICDLSAMPFQHPFGWVDENGDGINDNFVDADGDGVNDLSGTRYVAMPGWADFDGDSFNDFFADADGDGINDLGNISTPYGHGFGWIDENGDGINDRFIDADGDGINDLAFGSFAGQGSCYGFMTSRQDTNGDGFDDVTGLPYRHGFGWFDANGDGTNDVFTDADGDGVNDYYGYHYDGGGYHRNQGFGGNMGMQVPMWPIGPGGMMN